MATIPRLIDSSTYVRDDTATATVHTVPYPTGTQAGDIIFMAYSSGNGSFAPSLSPSFHIQRATAFSSSYAQAWRLTTGETSVTFTFSVASMLGVVLARIDGSAFPAEHLSTPFQYWEEAGTSSYRGVLVANGGTFPSTDYTFDPGHIGNASYTAADPGWPGAIPGIWFEGYSANASSGTDTMVPPDAPEGWALVDSVFYDYGSLDQRTTLYYKRGLFSEVTFPAITLSQPYWLGRGNVIWFYDEAPTSDPRSDTFVLSAKTRKVQARDLPYQISGMKEDDLWR